MLNIRVIICLCVLFCQSGLAWAGKYQQKDTPNFSFFYNPKEEKELTDIIQQAESIRKKISNDLGMRDNNKIRVYLADSRDEFQKLQPAHPWRTKWAVGTAYSELNLIILLSPRALKTNYINLIRTFKHELTHIILGHTFRQKRIPKWLNEGLAMYESKEWSIEYITSMTIAIVNNSLIPLDELTNKFPMDFESASLAYAQSFYLVSYLLTKNGKASFHEFLNEYSKNNQLEDALEKTYQVDLVQLEKQWHKHLKLRFSIIPMLFSAGGLWFIITLIFIFSYWKKRNESRTTLSHWESAEKEQNDHHHRHHKHSIH